MVNPSWFKTPPIVFRRGGVGAPPLQQRLDVGGIDDSPGANKLSNQTESSLIVQAYISLLRRRPAYLKLWIAQAVSLLGDWFTTIALSTVVARYSGGSGLAGGALVLARFVPALLVGPFAGGLVDSTDPK